MQIEQLCSLGAQVQQCANFALRPLLTELSRFAAGS